MNKVLAEIIAGVIPHQMARNRWRGILRYGVIKGAKLLARLKREKDTPPKHYLAVCAIAKNEGAYFQEWIEWHKKMGAEKFYIYDNESTDNTKDILAPYVESGLVEYTFWPGRKQQLSTYDNCLDRHRLEARWIAVIDLDEFIVPVRDKSIPEFLKTMENFPAVEVNWLLYGSGGAKTKEPGGVMERFKHHSVPDNPENRFVKTIVDPRRVFSMIGCHEAAIISGRTVNTRGEAVKRNFKYREPVQDVIRINHYPVKSLEEFMQKRARGRARTHNIRGMDYFERFDMNDIEDERRYL